MKIVLQLTGPDGVSELVTIEPGSNFTVPDGMTVEIVSLEGVDDLRVEGGELVLAGSGGTIRIAGLGADFLAETASVVENGIDGPLPDVFLRLFGWLDTPDAGSRNIEFGPGIYGQGQRAGDDDDGLPPPLDRSNDGDTVAAPSAPVISSWSDDTGLSGDGITSDTTLTLSGTAEAGATVTLFDGDTELGSVTAGSDGTWIFETAALADATHEFTATATDAGGTGEASAPVTVTVDTAAPEAPVISGYSADTGATGDGITSDTTLTLTGTAEAGATVEIFDGATSLGTTVADGAGAWSFTTSELDDGEHDFTATATDAAGNTGDISNVFAVEVDTAAPAAPVISGFSDDTGTQGDGVTSDTTLTLTGTADAGTTVTIFDGATEIGTALTDGAGAWNFTTTALGEGEHDFTATATDAAGNTGDASEAFAVEVDTAAPDAPVISGFSGDTGIADDGITSDTTLTLTGTADAGTTVTIFDGATELGTALADGAGAWSFTTGELGEGEHEFTATATDAAGNTGDASGVFIIEVDTAAPAAPVISGFSNDTGTQGDGITSDTTLTLTGTAEEGATVTIFDGAIELGTALANGAGAWSFTTGELGEGEHDFTATQTDAAGNTGDASAVFPVEIDTSGPSAPVITGFSADTGIADDGITSDTTLTLTGTADAGTTITVFDGPHMLGTAIADGDGNWSFDTAVLTEGEHQFTATATDAADNIGERSENFDVVVDVTPPAIEITTPVSGDGLVNASEGGSLSVSGTAAGGQQVFVTFRDAGGVTVTGGAFVDGSGDWTLSGADISGLENGEISIEVYAVDRAGNQSGTVTETVTFDSGLPDAPVITGFTDNTGFPGDNLTYDTTPTLSGTAEAGTTVEIFDGQTSLGTASVDGAGNWSFTTGTLAEGAHTLTARATDEAGNGGPVSAPLNLGIDTTAPAVSIATPIAGDGLVNAAENGILTVSGTSVGGQRVYVTFTDDSGATVSGSATVDGLGNWTLNADISGLDEGTITVEAYAEDQAGNRSDTVDVAITHDSVAPDSPVITGFSEDTGSVGDGRTSDNTVTLTGTAAAGVTVEIFIGVTSLGTVVADEAGAWSFTSDELADGSHYFNAVAIDTAGNKSISSDNYIVTVDTAPPGLTIATPISGDGIVNASEGNSVSLSGTAPGGQRVYVTFTDEGGATVTGETIVVGGNWTLSGVDISGLADGDITVEAHAVDQAGNSSGTVTETIGHDTGAPAAPVIAGFSDDSGAEGDNLTNDTTPTLTGTAQAGTTVHIRDGGTLFGTAEVDGDGNWSFTTPELAEGSHSLTAQAVDAAGNLSLSANLGLTIDTTAHAVAITTPIATDNIVNAAEDGSVSVSGTALGAQRVHVTFRDEGGATVDGGYAIVVGGGNWTLSGVDISGLQNGEITAEAYSVDQAGNQSDTATETVTLDNAAPAAPVIVDFSDDTGFDGDNQTADNTLTFTGTAEAGVTVNVYLGAAIVATGIADVDGNWTAATGTLDDGYSIFTARAVDAVGNQSGVSTPFVIIIDTEAPAAPTLDSYSLDTGAAGDGVTGDSNLLLSGTSPAGVSRIVIYDNGVEIGTVIPNAGAWTFQTGALPDGDHSFTAAARDNVGNESAGTDALAVTIDTEIPDAPVITGFSDDTGAAGDGVTADTTLTIAGTSEANVTISIFNQGSFLGTTTADGNGDWSYDASALNQGAHTFTARAADVAGNVSPMSDSLDVTISIPVTPAPVITGFSGDSGTVGDFLTNDATLTIEGTSVADATVEVFRGGVSLGTTTADGSGNWSFTTEELADGGHIFHARATAPLSSPGTYSDQFTVTVDATAPVVTISDPVDGDNIVGAFSDGSLTVSGSVPGGQQVFVTFRDGAGATVTGTASVSGGGAWTLTGADISALDNGTVTIEVYAVDQAGNQSDTVTHDILLDNDVPAAPVISGFSDDTGTQANSTSDTTLTFTGTAEANATVQLFRGGSIAGTVTADGDGSWTITTGELSEGYATYQARAVDAAGNTSGWSNDFYIDIDTTAPATPAILAFSEDSGVQGDGLTNDTALTLTGTGAAGSTVVIYDGGVELGTAQVNGGTWSFTTATLTDGDHSFTAAARDGAGNESAKTAAFDVAIDATRPDIPVITGYSDDTGNPDFQTSDNTLVFTGTAGVGETVNVYLGQTLVASGVADENGDWSAATGVIADGFHYFYARAVDAAGNQSLQTGNYVVSVDTVAPAAPAIAGFTNDNGAATDDGISSSNWTYLSGTAAAGSSTVVIYRDGAQIGTAAVSGGSWTFLVSALPEGTHTFTAAARDFVGNESGESNEVEFTVDLTAPPVPVLVSMSDDTGTPGDFRTFDTTPTFSGTAEAGATVTVRDGATVLGTTVADIDGNWSYTADTLAEGSHSITVMAADAAGRSSSYSGAQLVFVDTTAPDAPVIAGFSDDSLPTGDGATSDTTPTFSGTAAANSLVEILSGGSVIGSVTSASNGTWSFTTEELAEGSYSFTARVADNAGNVSDESAALDLAIGNGAPPATATPVIALYSNDTGVSGDGITNDTALDLYGTAANGASVEIFDGGVSLGTATADGAGNWHFLTGTLAEGDHDFTVVATAPGGYGPSDPSAALSVTVDTAAPAAPVITGYGDDTGHSSSDNQTSDNTLTFTGTADANVTINIFRGGGIVATTTADGNGDWLVTTGTIADGYATYEARALDAAGNMSATSNSITIGIDTVAPAAPVITGFSPDSGTQGDGVTTNNFIAITGTAEGGTRHVVVYDNGFEVGQATVNGTTWVFYTESLSEGAHEFTAVAYDHSGNESGESGALTVTIDDTAPAVPVITAISEDTGSSTTDMQTTDTTPTIIGTADAGATVRVFINGVSAGVTVADGNGDWSFTTGTLADGYHNVTARTEDAAGNQSAQTGAMYVVVDTTPPAITVTTPIAGDNLVNASEDNYFNVSGTSQGGQTVYVTFTDELGGTVTGTATVNGTSWTLSGANITGLQNGEITVEAYAVDRAGNQSGTVTNTIELDNVAPAAPVISGFTDDTGIANNQTSDTTPTLTGTAGAGETVRLYLAGNQIASTVADGDGNWSVTTSALPEGYHSITARALDDAGNLGASSSSQIVWVDTTAPAAPTIDSWGSDTGDIGDGITDANTITLSGTRPVATVVNVYDNGVLLGTVPNTGTTWFFTTSVLPDGEHSFTVTGIDAAANESAPSAALDIIIGEPAPEPFAMMFAPQDTGGYVAEGTSGDDTFYTTGTDIASVIGGEGYDTLTFAALDTPQTLDLTLIGDDAIESVERLHADTSFATIRLEASDILAMSDDIVGLPGDEKTRLTVTGVEGSKVEVADTGWSFEGTETDGGATYNIFGNGTAQLYVQDTVDAAGTLPAVA